MSCNACATNLTPPFRLRTSIPPKTHIHQKNCNRFNAAKQKGSTTCGRDLNNFPKYNIH